MGDLILAALATILQRLFAGFARWMVTLMADLQAQGFHFADSAATRGIIAVIIPVALAMLMIRVLYGIVHDYMIQDSAGTTTGSTP